MQIQPYLFFQGCCEEALDFYRQAIDAEIQFMLRFDESPDPQPPEMVPAGWEKKIMHASLRIGETVVMASDDPMNKKEDAGFEGFSLSLSVSDAETAERVFAALADGGEVRMPLGKTFWSPCFGMVADRFGVGWMVSVQGEEVAAQGE